MSRVTRAAICVGLLAIVVAVLFAAPTTSQAADRYWPRYWRWYDREYTPYYYSVPAPYAYGYYGAPYDNYYSTYPPGVYSYEYRSPYYYRGPRVGVRVGPGVSVWY